jgi:hypothetical protein
LIVAYKKPCFAIGLKYKDHPIIWEYPRVRPNNLRQLAEFIYTKYSINSSKSDKIFSELPLDVSLFLEDNFLSENYWRLGFTKRIKKDKHDELNIKEIEAYYKKLEFRNQEYQTFNKILISILKGNSYNARNVWGHIQIKMHKGNSKNKLNIEFYSESDGKTYTDVLPIEIFSPTLWNSVDSSVDKSTLVLFNS